MTIYGEQSCFVDDNKLWQSVGMVKLPRVILFFKGNQVLLANNMNDY